MTSEEFNKLTQEEKAQIVYKSLMDGEIHVTDLLPVGHVYVGLGRGLYEDFFKRHPEMKITNTKLKKQ